jgi:hypothetical protein
MAKQFGDSFFAEVASLFEPVFFEDVHKLDLIF